MGVTARQYARFLLLVGLFLASPTLGADTALDRAEEEAAALEEDPSEAAEDELARVEERTLEATVSAPRTDSCTRPLDPYGLVEKESNWYVVGHDHDRGRVVHLRLQEVEALTLTDRTFERPDSYRTPPDGPDRSPTQKIRVLFDEEAAPSNRKENNEEGRSKCTERHDTGRRWSNGTRRRRRSTIDCAAPPMVRSNVGLRRRIILTEVSGPLTLVSHALTNL